ncbi:hypothetical protein SUGI_0985310 [Cryptomeria japonica]|nr:hypothetical protein SUGI_0985310 [Cryptomeria japonica]
MKSSISTPPISFYCPDLRTNRISGNNVAACDVQSDSPFVRQIFRGDYRQLWVVEHSSSSFLRLLYIDTSSTSRRVEAPFKRIRKINLRFRIPYYTQWGENLVVCGSDPAVGGWDVNKAVRMVPYHQGDILYWHATLTVAHDFSCNYNYFLVDEQRNVLKQESGKRQTFTLPQSLPDGASVDVYDLWLDGSAPSSLLSKSAFQKAIFHQDENKENHDDLKATIQQDDFLVETFNMQDSVLVRFMLCCPKMESGKIAFLTGSASALGNWNFKESVRLSYCADAYWKADCIIKKDEFPIRYPFITSSSFFPSLKKLLLY